MNSSHASISRTGLAWPRGHSSRGPPVGPPLRRSWMRRVVRESLALYGRYWLPLASVSIAVYTALAVVTPLLTTFGGVYGEGSAVLFYLAGIFWAQGALVKGVDDIRAGRPLDARTMLVEGVWRRVNALSAAGLLAALGIYMAWAALVVPGAFVVQRWSIVVPFPVLILPGLVLLTRWSLIVPAVVLEECDVFGAFHRSADLVRGDAVRIFGVVVATAAALFAALAVDAAAGDLARAMLPGDIQALGVSAFTTIAVFGFATPLVTLTWTLVYYELRGRRDAAPPPSRVRLRASDLLDEAWRFYRLHASWLLGIAAIVFAFVSLAQIGLAQAGLASLPASVALTFVGAICVQTAVAGAFDASSLVAPPPGAIARSLRPRWRALLGSCALGGVAFATVYAILVLPGLLVGAVWSSAVVAAVLTAAALSLGVVAGAAVLAYASLIAPLIVLERRRLLPAWSASRRLVAGSAASVLRVLATPLVLVVVVSSLVAGLVVPIPGLLWDYVASVIANSVTAPYAAVAWTLMYLRLRELDASGTVRLGGVPARAITGG